MMTETFDRDKFKELILYLAKRSDDDATFGATKLNKLLFYSDFLAYGELGEPITGATYQKLKFGPAPKELLPVQQEMKAEGSSEVKRQSAFNPDKTVALREPDISKFRPEEIAVIDAVVQAFRNHNATEVSEASHRFSAGWQVAAMYEEIPYSTVFIWGGQINPAAIEFGRDLAEREGWAVPA